MTGYLKPEEVIIYLETENGAELFNDHRFRKDPDGNIQVYKAFWKKQECTNDLYTTMVNPLITYADLIGTGDIRNLEAAEEILGGELAELIRED